MPDALETLRQELALLRATLTDLAARVADLEVQVLLLTHQARESPPDTLPQ